MGLIKLAGQTGKAFKGLFKAIGSDFKSAKGKVKQTVEGAVQGAKTGDVAHSYLEQLKKNKRMGQRIQDLRKRLKESSSEALKGQKAQAEYFTKQHNTFKDRAKNIIKKHKMREKVIAGSGAVATLGAGTLAYKLGKSKKEK